MQCLVRRARKITCKMQQTRNLYKRLQRGVNLWKKTFPDTPAGPQSPSQSLPRVKIHCLGFRAGVIWCHIVRFWLVFPSGCDICRRAGNPQASPCCRGEWHLEHKSTKSNLLRSIAVRFHVVRSDPRTKCCSVVNTKTRISRM